VRKWAMAVTFEGTVRRWREDKPGGLAVVDVPGDLVGELGGRRQMRVTGTLNGFAYTGSTMLVAGGGLCVGICRPKRSGSPACSTCGCPTTKRRPGSSP